MNNDAPARIPFRLLDKTSRNPVLKLIEKIEQQEQSQPEHIIICTQCNNPITTEHSKIPVNGSNEHTFTNPYGYIFHIICFKEALGCLHEGNLVSADTWFPGYFWQYALCAHCNIHLGWYYTAEQKDYFYGLIKDRIQAHRQQ